MLRQLGANVNFKFNAAPWETSMNRYPVVRNENADKVGDSTGDSVT